MLHHMLTVLCSSLLLTLAVDRLYTCQQAGVTVFSDRPCRGIPSIELPENSGGVMNMVQIPPLTAAEQARLDELASTTPARTPNTRRRMRTETAARADACANARDRLDAIREQRRKGYTLKEVPKLTAAADRLTRDIRRYCR